MTASGHRLGKAIGISALLLALWPGLGRAQAAKPGPPAPPEQPPDIYDVKADAKALVEAAKARARRDHRRVLVMFGGNWCGWCHKLHALLQSDPEIRRLMLYEYELAMVDTDAPNAPELFESCKNALSDEELKNGVGFPFLAVLDADGKILTAQRTDPLEDGDHHDPEKVKNFLTRWVAEPLDARKVLDDALDRASSQDRRVFLHFGAPWCGWCHRLDDFLARPEIASILERDFIDLKIDVDRMENGQDVLRRFRRDDSGGIPWFVVLDPKGNPIATSDGPKGNVGFPVEPHEIAHVLDLLKRTTRRATPEQLAAIETALKESANRIKAGR